MKYAKTVGLAIAGAAILLAIVGAGTASATVLCTNNESTSSCTEPYEAGTEVASSLASGTKAKLETEFKTIECGKSAMSGKTERAGSATETVKAPVVTLTFEECNCEVKVLKKGTMELHWISGGTNGTVTENGGEVTVNCSTILGTVHCVYKTANTDLGTLAGGSPGKLTVNASLPYLTTSGLCSEATWEASYELTKPSPLYVTEAAAPTKLCAEAAANCLEGQTYPENTEFKGTATIGELALHWKGAEWTMSCKKYVLRGETLAGEGDPLETFTEPTFDTCVIAVPKEGTCQVAMKSEVGFGFGVGSLVAKGNEKDGRWEIGMPILRIWACEYPKMSDCEFKEPAPVVSILGGKAEAAKLEADRNFTFIEGEPGDEWPEWVTWKVTYVIGKEGGAGNLFVTH